MSQVRGKSLQLFVANDDAKVRRNKAIVARNRNMKQLCRMFGKPYKKMPLEK